MPAHKFAVSILTLLSFYSALNGQKVKGSTQQFSWSTARLTSSANVDHKHTTKHDFDNYSLPVTEKERIIPVSGAKNWSLVRMNDDAKLIWQFDGMPNELMGIGMMGTDVIAFCANNAAHPKKITAILIDAAKGTRKNEKTIYESSSPAKTEVKIQNRSNGTFNDLIVITDQKGEVTIQVLYVNADLTVSQPVSLRPSLTFARFAGSLVEKTGEIVIADFSDDQFTVFKFTTEGKEVKKLAFPVTRRSDDFKSMIRSDKNNEEITIASINYKNEKKEWANQIIRFDLPAGKTISSQPEILEKDYAKTLTLETIKGVMDGNLKWIEEAEIAGIVQWQNKFVLLKEIRTSVSSDKNTRFVNHAWIASIYDENLTLKKTIGLDKKYESFIQSSLSLGFNIHKDRLVILAPALAGLGTSTATFVSLNMNTEEIEKAIAINELKAFGSGPIEAGATLWFDDKFLLHQLKPGNSFFNQSSNSIIHKVEM